MMHGDNRIVIPSKLKIWMNLCTDDVDVILLVISKCLMRSILTLKSGYSTGFVSRECRGSCVHHAAVHRCDEEPKEGGSSENKHDKYLHLWRIIYR